MKVLAFVDLHGWFDILDKITQTAKEEDVDLILCSGDITTFGKNLTLILKRLNEIGKPILLIPGNHEDSIDLENKCANFKNIVYLHKSSYIVGEYIFFGYGSGGFARKDSAFVKISKQVEKDSNGKKLVILFHGPPYKTKLDFVHNTYVGNEDYTNFIKKTKPILVMCGHIHETSEQEDFIGDSRIINPGPNGRILDI